MRFEFWLETVDAPGLAVGKLFEEPEALRTLAAVVIFSPAIDIQSGANPPALSGKQLVPL